MKTFRLQYSIAIILALLALTMLLCTPAIAQDCDKQDSSIAKVVKIVDGDTFDIDCGNDIIRVRVLNLDTYETRLGERLATQAERNGISVERALSLGKKAKSYAIETILGKEVLLHRGNRKEPNRDKYGRLLRYVEYNYIPFEHEMKMRGYDSRK